MFNEEFKHGKTFNVNADDFPFTTLNEFIEQNGHQTLVVNGVFSYKAKHGVRPVLIAKGLKIHLPDHCLKDVEKILAHPEYCEAINQGKCGFKTTTYTDKDGVERNSGLFVDI